MSNFKHDRHILFLVDHKHRDLPSLSLIGFFLCQMNYEVKYVALLQEDAIMRSFNPRYLILPKPIYELSRLIKYKLEGRKLIIIDTEGNSQYRKFKMNIKVPPDLYFFWNRIMLERHTPPLSKKGTILKLLGCPRLDFFHQKYAKLYSSRESLLKKYGLSRDNKTITIATSTPDSHFSDERLKNMAKIRKRILLETADYQDIVSNMRILRDVAEKMIHFIILKYPNLNIVVKPHPNENVIFWRDLINSLPTDKIRLCIGEPINHLLKVSDLHIAHNVCSTVFESLLMGIPAVEIHTDLTQKLYKKEHLQLATYTIKTVEELGQVIQQELFKCEKNEELEAQQKKKLQSYINKYFYRFDGLRCHEYAREIAEFIQNSSCKSTFYGQFFVSHPEYVFPYLKAQIRLSLRQAKRFIKKTLFSKRTAKDTESEEMPADIGIDSRGRYDNRIKPGDEEYWFEKFDRGGFRIKEFEKNSLNKNDSSDTITRPMPDEI